MIDGEYDTQGWNRYSYVKGNPIRYKDPSGHEVEATFNIERVTTVRSRKTGKIIGHTATGTVTMKDKDKEIEERISIAVTSGGKSIGDPIPEGDYDILDQENDPNSYRLESKDKNYGDDRHEKTGRTVFRFHKRGSGATYGCMSVDSDEEWEKADKMLKSTKTSISSVDYQGRIPFKKKERVIKFGELKVIDNRSSKQRQMDDKDVRFINSR